MSHSPLQLRCVGDRYPTVVGRKVFGVSGARGLSLVYLRHGRGVELIQLCRLAFLAASDALERGMVAEGVFCQNKQD